MHEQFEIEEVDLRVTRPETTRILIAQAFWPEEALVTKDGLYFHRDPGVAAIVASGDWS